MTILLHTYLAGCLTMALLVLVSKLVGDIDWQFDDLLGILGLCLAWPFFIAYAVFRGLT